MTRPQLLASLCVSALALTGCFDSSSSSTDSPSATASVTAATPTTPDDLDTRCDEAEFPSAAWSECELTNFARTVEATTEQLSPAFQQRYLEQSLVNLLDWGERALTDLSWAGLPTLNTPLTPLCATNSLPCTGDPFRHPDADGPDGQAFFDNEAVVEDVVFYDQECARLSGKVWAPRNATAANPLPTVVITNGSVQAPETAYRWAAQALVRAGYLVMTYDPRGQGRSDFQAPSLSQGSNINPKVFWEGQVNAIDFFRSSPNAPYPHNERCEGTYPTDITPFNPRWDVADYERLGIAGHSLGAIGISVVQGYGAPGAAPWPGLLDQENPVDVAVAWDSLITPDGEGLAPAANLPIPDLAYDAFMAAVTQGDLPTFEARVPALNLFADYGFAPLPYLTAPDPNSNLAAFRHWQDQGVPAYALGIQGTTHFDFSLLPVFPATSWCPEPETGQCSNGWGNPSIEYYTLAWFDRWLKAPGEPGFDDADQRLVDDAWEGGAERMSFHYHSARDFPDRSGQRQLCESIREGCER